MSKKPDAKEVDAVEQRANKLASALDLIVRAEVQQGLTSGNLQEIIAALYTVQASVAFLAAKYSVAGSQAYGMVVGLDAHQSLEKVIDSFSVLLEQNINHSVQQTNDLIDLATNPTIN